MQKEFHKEANEKENSSINTYTYIYNKQGRIIKKEIYSKYQSQLENELIGFAEFFYKNGRLISSKESEGLRFQNNKLVTANYDFNSNGNLIKMKVEYDNFYREIKYEYVNDKISSIKIITNTDNNAYLKHWANTRNYYFEKMPFDYEEKFEYDVKGNLILKKNFINNELNSLTKYLVDYYE